MGEKRRRHASWGRATPAPDPGAWIFLPAFTPSLEVRPSSVKSSRPSLRCPCTHPAAFTKHPLHVSGSPRCWALVIGSQQRSGMNGETGTVLGDSC